MISSISLIISLIANAGLIYYLFKLKNKFNNLEIKLKVTRDYANEQAEKTLTKVRKEAKEVTAAVADTVVTVIDQVANKKRRGRRKKNTNV